MTRDEACRACLALVHLEARRLVRKHNSHRILPHEDLVSAGLEGLLHAFDRFEESHGMEFRVYARYRVRGAMYDALRREDAMSRRHRDLARSVQQATQACATRLGRSPRPLEVAQELDLTLSDYYSARDRSKPVSVVSLEARATHVADTGVRVLDILPDRKARCPERLVIADETRSRMARAIEALPPRQRLCMNLYYLKDWGQSEIAESLGVTTSRVCQILKDAREMLRRQLGESMLPQDVRWSMIPR